MEKTEFLDWLDGFKGTGTIQFIIQNHAFTSEELDRMRDNFGQYLEPKQRKEKAYAHLG